MFDRGDPDIRICAAMFFSDFAPELADAARHGVMANVSTREALASVADKAELQTRAAADCALEKRRRGDCLVDKL